ncbi:MAG: tyrosine-type recombinase/integrase [Planctomycetota bacterium]
MDIHKHGPTYRMRFKDPSGVQRKLRLARSKRVSDSMANKVALLVEHVHAQSPIPDDLVAFVLKLDKKRQQQLSDWGIVDRQKLVISAPLEHQLEQWEKGINNRGRQEGHGARQRGRVQRVFDAAGFKIWQDIDAEKVLQVLEDWREAKKLPGWNRKNDLTETTLAHYLRACKAFTRWVVRSGYTTKDPLVVLNVDTRKQPAKSKPSPQSKRRALTSKEQGRLVSKTTGFGVSFGVDGPQRALIYHTALRTGLRQSAIRQLKARDVDADGCLMAGGNGAGNKQTTPKPIRGKLLADLVAHAKTRLPAAPLFDLPSSSNMARMLKADAKEAKIDTAGVDFHCLRHTFCTEVGQVVTNVKTAQRLMDHADVKMTMRYMHSWPEDEVSAMERLPEIGSVVRVDKQGKAAG